MPRFGDFDTVREVSGGLWGAVYIARNPAGDERFAVKVFSPPAYQIDEAQLEADTVSFLEAAQAQSEISSVSEGLWSPIYQADRCEGGAWFATDLFDRSAEKLVLYRRDLEGSELQHVISSVLLGLRELRVKAGRPHGNLKPTNVLIAGRNDLSKARVALTDLVAGAKVRPDEDASRDLHDVGDLIHQLVLHRQLTSVSAWPVQFGEQWQRLGTQGKSWLAVCNALLDPTGRLPTLDEAIAMLPGGTTRVVAEPPRSSRVGRVKGLGSSSRSGSGSGSGIGFGLGSRSASGFEPERASGVDSGLDSGLGSGLGSATEPGPGEGAAGSSAAAASSASATNDARSPENVVETIESPKESSPESSKTDSEQVAKSQASAPVIAPRSSSEFEVTVEDEEADLPSVPGRSGASQVSGAERAEVAQRSGPVEPDRELMNAGRSEPSGGSGRWIAASVAALLVVGGAALVVTKLMGPKGGGSGTKVVGNTQPTNGAKKNGENGADDQAQKQAEAERVRLETLAREKQAKIDADAKAERDRLDKLAKDTEAKDKEAKDKEAKEKEAKRIEAENASRIAKEAKEAEDKRLALLEADRIKRESAEKEREAKESESQRDAANRSAIVTKGNELSALLARGFVSGEPDGGGSTIEARLRAMEAMPGFADAKGADADFAGVVARAASLAELAKIVEPKAAAARAGEEVKTPGRVSEARQFWLNLTAPEQKTWPGSSAAFEEARSLFTALDREYAKLSDKPRGAALRKEAADGVKRLWRTAITLASTGNGFESDAPELEKLIASSSSVGIAPDEIPGTVRFNFLLRDLRLQLAKLGPTPDEAAQRAALKVFADAVSRLPADVQQRAEVAAAIKAVAGLMAAPVVPAAGGQSPAEAGPKRRGFGPGVVGNVDGVDRVVFPGPGGRELEFLRVSPSSFVSTQEVSVGLFIDTVEKAGRWPDVMASLNLQNDGAALGPRGWDFNKREGKIELATPLKGAANQSKGWLQTKPAMKGVIYPQGVNVDPPKLDTPMQYVTPQAAVLVAELLGCRVPTTEEWKAAVQVETQIARGGGGPNNRRDATWEKVLDQARSNNQAGMQPNSPEQDFFTAGQRIPDALMGKAPAAVEGVSDDGFVWFAPVNQGGGVRFHHLVGNVAEYVYDDPAALSEITDPAASQLGGILRKGDLLKVIGASALSPKEIVPDTAYPWGPTRKVDTSAPSDVGFRLAFSVVGAAAPSLPLRAGDEVAKLSFIPSP